jgi:hypothetical protein
MTRNPSEHGQDTAHTGISPRPADTARGPGDELLLVTGHAEMDAAFERGVAVPVSASIGWLMRYRGAWWVLFEEGWLRVIEGPIADTIDRLHPQIAAAEAAARDSQATRGARVSSELARDEEA